MLFNAIRIALLILLIIVLVLIIRKSKFKQNKALLIMASVFCIILVTVFSMFPIENLFINYKSPESVFGYAKTGTIYEIIYGNDSSLVIYREANGSYSHYIVPKTTKGYKIPNYFTESKIIHNFNDDGVFEVYNVKGTEDYYIFGSVNFNGNSDSVSVFDSSNEKIKCPITRIKNTNFVFIFLPTFSDDYYLMINGEQVPIA